MELQDDADWLVADVGRPLSFSLPFNLQILPVEKVANYFDNPLLESDESGAALPKCFEARSTETFNLLQAIGRDCVGAVQISDEGEVPSGSIESRPRPCLRKMSSDT